MHCDAPAEVAEEGAGAAAASSTGPRPGALWEPTGRDVAVEDEIFSCGYFADVAFQFRGPSGEVEEVYGQSALFSLLSPVLRQVLLPGAPGGHAAAAGRREVHLDDVATLGAFREIARYVYRLEPRLSMPLLPDLLLASRLLGMRELEDLASAWGLAQLRQQGRPGGAAAEDADAGEAAPPGGAAVEDVLRCLGRLCNFEPVPPCVKAWREALLETFDAEQVFASPEFLDLTPLALRELLEGETLREDALRLWAAFLDWARARDVGAVASPPALSPRSPRPAEGDLDVAGPAPRKLFGKGRRLVGALAPAAPSSEEVAWQRPLLDVVDLVPFGKLSATEFTGLLEALSPVLPELRSAIYATRRRDAAQHPA